MAVNAAVAAQTDGTASRALLAAGSALGGGMVVYIRSTAMSHNQRLLDERSKIRNSITNHVQWESRSVDRQL